MVNNGIYKPNTFDQKEQYHIRTLTARRNILQGHKTYSDNHKQTFNRKEAEELEALNWVLLLLDEISYD